jgi:hypothetical protein
MQEVFVDYSNCALHPADVKNSLAKATNEMLQVKQPFFKWE